MRAVRLRCEMPPPHVAHQTLTLVHLSIETLPGDSHAAMAMRLCAHKWRAVVDRYAWLRDIFARIHERQDLGLPASVHQFE
jgi:hypothetical protein